MPEVQLSWDASTDPDWSDTRIYCGTTQGGPYDYDGSPTYDTSPKSVGLVSFASFTVPDEGTFYFVVRYVIDETEDDASAEVRYPIPGSGTPSAIPVLSAR